MKDACNCNLGFTWYVHGTEKLRIGGKTIPVVLKIVPVVLVVVGRLVHNEPNSIVGCLASYK